MTHNPARGVTARVAAWRYGNPARGIKIIAVAGAHGKTTTALLLAELLQEAGSSVAALTNHGVFINGQKQADTDFDSSARALQRQLLKARKKRAYYLVLEVTNALAQLEVLSTLPLEMSVIVNDSDSAQALLEQPVNATVLPSGFSTSTLKVAPHQVISFGTDQPAEACISNIVERRKGTEVTMVIDHQTRVELATYLVGTVNAYNVAAAVSAAYVLAIPTSHFPEGIARLESVEGNYQYLPSSDALYDVVVDGASDPHSVEPVLVTAKKLKKRRVMVVADSTVKPESYQFLISLADRVTIVGSGDVRPGIEWASDVKAALDITLRAAKRDDTVLLLGTDFAQAADGITMAQELLNGEPTSDEQPTNDR